MTDSTPSSPPPARGVRLDWDALPPSVHAAVADQLGSLVVGAQTQHGGFSPGVAARLVTADGRRAFVKAGHSGRGPGRARFHQREVGIVSRLPPAAPVPRLLWSCDGEVDGWEVLLFEDIDGQLPREPWLPADVDRVAAAIVDLHRVLTPSPIPEAEVGTITAWSFFCRNSWALLDAEPQGSDAWWRRNAAKVAVLEARAPAATRGDTLLHVDLRADNILLTPERVWFIDWEHARVGAPWLDMVLLAPSVAMQGGPPPEELIRAHPAARAAKPDHITAALAAVAGIFTWEALQPPPPGLPTLRAFQAAQGELARRWLAERTGLD